ncbi:MAG: helix-turn-helix domain-containing protein [Nocardioidaceae bacterium]
MATVERAVAVLHALADSHGDLGNNEIARRTSINASTVSRLLATLAQDELVTRVTDTGRFRLGPRLVELGNAALARVDMRQICRPHLEALTRVTGETATLSVPYEEGTITVDFVQSPVVRAQRRSGRPPGHRPRDRHRQGVPRVRRLPACRATAVVHQTDDHRRLGAGCGGRRNP